MISTSKHLPSAALHVLIMLLAGILSVFATDRGIEYALSKPSLHGTDIVCRIHPLPYGMYGDALLTGYSYHLVKEFAESIEASIDIRPCGNDDFCLDSIKAGSIDILVFPYHDSLRLDSVLVSVPVDSISVWIFSAGRNRDMARLNRWISEYCSSEKCSGIREAFLHGAYPNVNMKDKVHMLSPYDSLFRKYAQRMNWDWHTLAAIAYQESRFHIESESHKGASGLMQLMPQTARRFMASNMFDPEESIRAASEYLNFLYRHYRRHSANEIERLKFTFAAYNAGEGRIDQCIETAASHGIDASYWSEVAGIFDTMDEFHGIETSSYVEKVNNLSERFKLICP